MLYFCELNDYPMSMNERPQFELILQGQDSIHTDSNQIIFRPKVDLPEEIELKVERPSLRLAETDTLEEAASSMQVREPIREEVLSVKAVEVEEEVQILESPDTLDGVLIDSWRNSGFSEQLWASESNDSVSMIPLDYFGFSEITKRENGAVTDNNLVSSSVEDSLILGDGVVETINEVEIRNPQDSMNRHTLSPLLGQNWFLIVIVGLVTIAGFLRFRWSKYLSDVFSAILFTNVAGKLQNTSGSSHRIPAFALEFLFYANFSLLFFQYMRLSGQTFFHLQSWGLLLALLGFLVVIFTLKFIVYRFVGWVFQVLPPTREYLFQSSVMSKAYGLILLPLVVVFPFLEPEARHWIPGIGFSVFILLYLIQIGRGVVANLRNPLSGYYIFLYLCALEILPLSILYKVLFY